MIFVTPMILRFLPCSIMCVFNSVMMYVFVLFCADWCAARVKLLLCSDEDYLGLLNYLERKDRYMKHVMTVTV